MQFVKLNTINQDVFAHLGYKEILWSAVLKLDAEVTTTAMIEKNATIRLNLANPCVKDLHVPEVRHVKQKIIEKIVFVRHHFKEMDLLFALPQVRLMKASKFSFI